MMGEIFTTPSRPFYQSTTILDLKPIGIGSYAAFIERHFIENGKNINKDTIEEVYRLFDGTTWYIQFVMNFLYADTMEKKPVQLERSNWH